MYGQTEATARMAYLPPLLAETAPGTIGIPVAGGSFTIEPLPERPLAGPADPEVGELVYHGPNVMLGYAESPADLALGRTVTELRTGDIGHQREDGLFEVVGRRSRVAKVFGLRLDLDHVEQVLAARGVVAAAADGDGRLVLAICSGAATVDTARVTRLVRDELGLPPSGLRLVTPTEMPAAAERQDRLPRGARPRGGAGRARPRRGGRGRPGRGAAAPPRRHRVPTPSSASAATRCPTSRCRSGWSRRSARSRPTGRSGRSASWAGRHGPRRRGRRVETGVLLRALGIVAIVGTHANLFALAGGAHVLLGVLGFNFARFHLGTDRTERTRHVARAVARIAVPSMLVIATVSLWTPGARLAPGAAAQRRHRAGRVGGAGLALLVHRGRGDADARGDRAARGPRRRPVGAALAVLDAVRALPARPAHPLRGRGGAERRRDPPGARRVLAVRARAGRPPRRPGRGSGCCSAPCWSARCRASSTTRTARWS